MTHTLKILKQFADAVLSGEKTFEVRENDRGFQKGDRVRFNVIDKDVASMTKDGKLIIDSHDLEYKVFEITYVLSGWHIDNGYVVFGIKCIGDVRNKRGEDDAGIL